MACVAPYRSAFEVEGVEVFLEFGDGLLVPDECQDLIVIGHGLIGPIERPKTDHIIINDEVLTVHYFILGEVIILNEFDCDLD